MRRLIFAINLTLDGCCDHTKLHGDDEIHDYHAQLLRNADVLVYGRKTYELMIPFWPDVAKNHSGPTKAINEFAHAFEKVKKIIVFSKSLGKSERKGTKIIGANLHEEIVKLKQEEGGDILTGGVDIPSQLIQLGLIDEYHFVVQPIVVGEGRRLLEGVAVQENLKLAESKILNSGSVALRYVKR